MAHTVNPVVDADGNYQGSTIEGHHEGYHRSLDQEFVELSDGIHHRFENVEVNEDLQDSEYTDENYFETLANLHGGALTAAINWAANGGMDPTWIQDFNANLDAGRFEEVNAGIETLLGLYDQQHPDRPSATEQFNQTRQQDESETDEPLTVDDLSEDDQQVVNEVIEGLQYNEPGGEEQAEYWQQAVAVAQQSGDETYAAIAAATAAFHSGDVSAAEAIDFVLSNYDIRDVARVYQALNG
jgi:hypothetical protein